MNDFEDRSPLRGPNDSWRTWLLTGARRPPVDRRRLRGSHKGLKRMLVEGNSVGGEKPYAWKEFSDALVRQAVGDAMTTLTAEDAQMFKLAYFGGHTNRAIAEELGVTEAAVQRRLRRTISQISAYVERGRALGRAALSAPVAWLAAHRPGVPVHHLSPAGAVAAVAAMVLAVQPSAGAPTSTPSPIPHVTAAAPPHLATVANPRAAAPDPTVAAPSITGLAISAPVAPSKLLSSRIQSMDLRAVPTALTRSANSSCRASVAPVDHDAVD